MDQCPIYVQGEIGALTRKPTLYGRKSHFMRSQGGECNSLILSGHRAGVLNPSGSPLPDLLIHSKSGLYVIREAVLIGEDDAKCGSIFDSLAGSLGLKWLFVSTKSQSTTRGMDR